MILSIVVILAIGIIGYIHYVGGLLSGLVSAVLAGVATVVAVNFYEPMAETISGGKYNDHAQGMCLLALFAIVYLVGRLVFDSMVPGNIRLPALADHIGGAVCGVFAGMLVVGLVTIALQSMPFGVSIAGYSRYAINADHDGRVPPSANNPAALDRKIYEELKNEDLVKDQSGLLIPVDDFVVGFVKHLSGDGAFANDKPFASIHPDLIQELFGQRIGIEPGAKHTLINKTGTQVEVVGAYILPGALPQKQAEFAEMRQDKKEVTKAPLAPEPNTHFVAFTLQFKGDAADPDDHLVRLSLGSIRIVTRDGEGWKNNFPIATVQQGTAWMNKPDDFMFIDLSKGDRGAHFLFQIDDKALRGGTAPAAPKAGAKAAAAATAYGLEAGTFIEVKRTAKLPLDELNLAAGFPPNAVKFYPMRKLNFFREDAAPPEPTTPTTTPPTETTPTTPESTTPTPRRTRTDATPTPPAPAPTGDNGWAQAPLEKPLFAPLNALPISIEAGTADADAEVVTTAASGHITAKQFDVLEVDGGLKSELTKGDHPIAQLMVPAGKRMVQVTLSVKAGADAWAWAANPAEYTVVDGAGAAYKPYGVIALATAGADQKLTAHYKVTAEVAKVAKSDGTLAAVTFVYLIPADQKAKEILFQAKPGGLPLEQ